MLHIALATVAGVDILVSWNFKHIEIIRRIRDEHYEIIRNTSHDEMVEYFRQAAEKARLPMPKEIVQPTT